MEQRESIIDVHESSKRQKNNIYDSVDRISALPNSILGVILSFLPTKNVVATSILSKRWNFMWLTDHSLDFYHEACSKVPGEDEDIKFLRFVSSVLHLLDVRSLNKFRLVWNPRYISSSHVSSWITIAIIRNVYELSLCVETPNGPFNIPAPFAMPMTVFSCGSLQSLELNNGISVSAAIVCCFPRLESLKLVSVVFESEEAFEKLISGSPKLNYLHLHTDIAGIRKYYTEVDDDFTYRIYSTSLTCLELCFKKYWRDRDYVDYRLKLEASSIEYLKICGSISDIFVQKSLSSLVEADFRIDINIYDISDSIGEIIQAFDRAKALILSEDVVDVLCQSRVGRSTEFKRLVKLEASTRCSEWDSLQDFIQNSDSLEAVIIHQNPDDCRGSDCVHLNWITPTEVPRCLSNSLKKVTIDRYCGFEDEYEMICYLLKHGSVLEAMNIHCERSRIGEELQLLKRVSKIPRKSPACELHWND